MRRKIAEMIYELDAENKRRHDAWFANKMRTGSNQAPPISIAVHMKGFVMGPALHIEDIPRRLRRKENNE